MGERAKRLEARCHSDRAGVDAAGGWSEGHASYPGRSAHPPTRLVASQGVAMGEPKSAEAIVNRRTRRRRAEHRESNRNDAFEA